MRCVPPGGRGRPVAYVLCGSIGHGDFTVLVAETIRIIDRVCNVDGLRVWLMPCTARLKAFLLDADNMLQYELYEQGANRYGSDCERG